MRELMNFDKNWLFHKGDIKYEYPVDKGPVYAQSKTERMTWGPASRHYNGMYENYLTDNEVCTHSWINVTLPHDYIIEQKPDKKYNCTLGYFEYTNAWYRKEFYLTEEDKGKKLTIIFDGVATHATVYLNGCVIGRNFCGYNTFYFDISDFVKFGDEKNVLSVYVQTEEHEGWWYEGGGIYRHVWLLKTDTVSADIWGVYVCPQKKANGEWEVNIQTEVVNDRYEDVDAVCKSTVIDRNGAEVAVAEGKVSVAERCISVANYRTVVKAPLLWDIDNPNLYTLRTDIYVNGNLCDNSETRFGFREFELNPKKGLFLNGKHIKIKGVCAHQDLGLTGKAVADNIHRYKGKLMKEMGANGFRTSQYPHTSEFMDVMDELGFIVMDETRWFSSSEESMKQLEMLVKRDRNRPSVLFWSLGNEEAHHTTEEGRRICKNMMSLVCRLDNSRVVMTAVSNDPDIATVYDELDAIGINYNLDKYDKIREKYPDKCIFSSECCASSTTRGWYDDTSIENGRFASYDMDMDKWFLARERTWKFISEREWVLGEYQWTAFEHRGETKWPRLCSQSGAIDLFLQKKDSFYQNQSHWVDYPMIHLLPHWNFEGREGMPVNVVAYTNCKEAELYLNGKSLGVVRVEKYGHAEWVVDYEPGELLVIGRNNSKEECRDIQITTEKPVKLKLELMNEDVCANGTDVALISCSCVDSQGREVPTASPYVSFNTNKMGIVIATGSDICDHNPVTLPKRKMCAGKITAAVRCGETEGELLVYAKADELTEAVISIKLNRE